MRLSNPLFGNGGCGYSNGCDNSSCGSNSSILFFILVFLVLFAY